MEYDYSLRSQKRYILAEIMPVQENTKEYTMPKPQVIFDVDWASEDIRIIIDGEVVMHTTLKAYFALSDRITLDEANLRRGRFIR